MKNFYNNSISVNERNVVEYVTFILFIHVINKKNEQKEAQHKVQCKNL